VTPQERMMRRLKKYALKSPVVVLTSFLITFTKKEEKKLDLTPKPLASTPPAGPSPPTVFYLLLSLHY